MFLTRTGWSRYLTEAVDDQDSIFKRATRVFAWKRFLRSSCCTNPWDQCEDNWKALTRVWYFCDTAFYTHWWSNSRSHYRRHFKKFSFVWIPKVEGWELVQQVWIRESTRRVDPEGVLLRALTINTVNRRKYQVYAPLALWHIDGNHKLIRLVDFASY